MSCIINTTSGNLVEWTISNESSKPILRQMYKPNECAGRFSLTYETGKNCENGTCKIEEIRQSILEKIEKGNATSVKTVNGYCNFHTHPFPCYVGEKTIWGWPSGEDMRECIGFALRGNLFHMVYTLEGIYVIQVNPNIIYILSNDEFINKIMPNSNFSSGIIRGILVSLIESYFRATHGHRTKKYNTTFGSNSAKSGFGICLPSDWINYTNMFTFDNMNTTQPNKCSYILPCNNFPEYNHHSSGTIDLHEFLKKYGSEIYDMDEKGIIHNIDEDLKNDVYNYLQGNFSKIVDFFNNIPIILSYGDEKWSQGQWFHTKIFYNKMKCGNKILDFEQFLNSRCPKNKNVKSLCDNIYKFWSKCESEKAIIFPDVKMKFKPFKPKDGKGTCSISHGPDILKWIRKAYK